MPLKRDGRNGVASTYYDPKADGDCTCPKAGIDHKYRETVRFGGAWVLICTACNGQLQHGSNVEAALRRAGASEETITQICGAPTKPTEREDAA